MSILVTGANGQIGTILTRNLREIYGKDEVIASDILRPNYDDDPFLMLDILNVQRIREIIEDFNITEIYHLAAILSANGEWNPLKTWNVNLNGLLSVLDLAREYALEKVFFPSTIAIHGPTTPKIDTPQDAPFMPTTVYGMSKLAGEYWCNYYHQRFGLDVRSLRYPGIIGHDSLPGGGTTDYAVEIFHEAINRGHYTCFLAPDTRLPMMYMDDAMRATNELMQADKTKIRIHSGYNLTGMSFTPAELADAIRVHIPTFTIDYKPDFRQEIAASWSQTIDDSRAKEDWGWTPAYDLEKMTADMIYHLDKFYSKKSN
ncbi:MAG: NAD-dependent epimerase/dehydratase family protein [Saprospiraceae bacterium]|nr:NAD-dependent epimerase/dehydratase family protein [Saprospiraceae bacterium]